MLGENPKHMFCTGYTLQGEQRISKLYFYGKQRITPIKL